MSQPENKLEGLRSYAGVLLATLALCLTVVLGINLLVDPLWHGQGNRITGQNMGFNERLSKLNLAKRRVADADCVIYGSSRATLLDASFVPGYRCFNMAVSQGLAQEFPLYAHELNAQGLEAKLLIIGADDLSFFASSQRNDAPLWLRQGGQAPAWWQDYLSLDTLQFSLRALAGKSPTPRYFQADFSINIEKDRRAYRPSDDELVAISPRTLGKQARKSNPEFLQSYRSLIAAHPEARVTIYVPPISIWRLAGIIRRGELMSYLDSIYALTLLGAPVWDYSVPSAITTDPALTYDGSHYNLAVNRQIARDLVAGQCQNCLAVHEMSQSEYLVAYQAAYRQWRQRLLK